MYSSSSRNFNCKTYPLCCPIHCNRIHYLTIHLSILTKPNSTQLTLYSGSSRNFNWAWQGHSILSEFGTLHMEFAYLSNVTGNDIFLKKVSFNLSLSLTLSLSISLSLSLSLSFFLSLSLKMYLFTLLR